MSEYIKYFLIILSSFGLGYLLSNKIVKSSIDSCEQNNLRLDSIITKLTLQIQSANQVYELLEDKNKLLRFKNKTLKSEKELSQEKDKIIEDLIKIKSEYESKKTSLDSLNQKLPNRDGEELIKSLKIKTNI